MIARLFAYVDSFSMLSLALAYAVFIGTVLVLLFLLLMMLDRHSATWQHDRWGRKWDDRQSKPMKTWRL